MACIILEFFQDCSNKNEKIELQHTDDEEFNNIQRNDRTKMKYSANNYKIVRKFRIKDCDGQENEDSDESIKNSMKKRNTKKSGTKSSQTNSHKKIQKNSSNLPQHFLPKNDSNAQKIIFFEIRRLSEAFTDLKKEKENMENKVRLLSCF